MSRRKKRSLPTEPVDLQISNLSHDGRGVAELEGKKVFVHGALPGELVRARLIASRRRYSEAEAVEILRSSPDRVEAKCPHFGRCGGCALQHLGPAAQIQAKQHTLLQNLERIGKVRPVQVLEPVIGPQWQYRRKARLSVRYVIKKEKMLVGFRERQGRFVAELSECHVLDKRVADLLPSLTQLFDDMAARDRIPQVEVACGDRSCALVVRHMDPLDSADLAALTRFAQDSGVAILLQGDGPESIRPLEPPDSRLEYDIRAYDLTLEFGPADFIQVNAALNRAMITQAVGLLEPGGSDRVLDLFCGLGNFTLPLARLAGTVTGVEGDLMLVEKARHNARRNGISNVEFHVADLVSVQQGVSWLRQDYDKVLLDPPRSGAQETLSHLAATKAHRVVYVSCHPASLARDAHDLVHRHGFNLQAAGVMDMFPHTSHVESIALFERKR